MNFTTAYRVVVAISLLLLTGGCLLLIAGCLPYSVIQPLGAWVRGPQDVTPERYHRYLAACWGIGLLSMGLGAVLFQRRRVAGNGLAIVCGAVPTWMAVPFRRQNDWGIEAWCIVSLGIGLRLIRMNEPMAYDEAYTFLNFARRPWYEAISDYNSTNNHLLNTLAMHGCYKWFGDGEAALRIPVFLAGVATLLLIYPWAKMWCGRRAALLATSLLAVSPLMITYSVDARGYMFVTAAALALDLAAAKLDRNSLGDHSGWISFTLAAIIGFWAMPIMLYAVAGTVLWFAASPFLYARGDANEIRGRELGRRRLQALAASGAVTILAVAVFYMPAFVFRGLQFLRDPIMVREPLFQYPAELGRSLLGAWEWWTEGAIPQLVWLAAVGAGLAWWPRSRWQRLRLAAPFAAVLVLNLLQRAAPPPRVYLFLFPWVAILAAQGALHLLDWLLSRTVRTSRGRDASEASLWVLTLAVSSFGSWYATTRPVLFHTAERDSFHSVREAILRLRDEHRAAADVKRRLYAPLPCDLPALFYREREELDLEINGPPQAGEELWLITRLEESPGEVLDSPLVNQPELARPGDRWIETDSLQTLRLFRDGRTTRNASE